MKSKMELTKEDMYLINGSGLFFFKSNLDGPTQLKIVKWYNNLSDEDRKYVDLLRSEASDNADFFSPVD